MVSGTYVLPIFDSNSLSSSEALQFYQKYQVLHVRMSPPYSSSSSSSSSLCSWTNLVSLYKEFPHQIAKAWSVENAGDAAASSNENSPFVLFLNNKSPPPKTFYVSCILQKEKAMLSKFLSSCPLATPPFFFDSTSSPASCWGHVIHSAPIWLFVGQNTHPLQPLQGNIQFRFFNAVRLIASPLPQTN